MNTVSEMVNFNSPFLIRGPILQLFLASSCLRLVAGVPSHRNAARVTCANVVSLAEKNRSEPKTMKFQHEKSPCANNVQSAMGDRP